MANTYVPSTTRHSTPGDSAITFAVRRSSLGKKERKKKTKVNFQQSATSFLRSFFFKLPGDEKKRAKLLWIKKELTGTDAI